MAVGPGQGKATGNGFISWIKCCEPLPTIELATALGGQNHAQYNVVQRDTADWVNREMWPDCP